MTTIVRFIRFSARVAIFVAFVCAIGCSLTNQTTTRNGVELGAHDPESPNPLFVKTQDPQALWEAIVDVVDNYYDIEMETPIRSYEQTSSDGTVYHYQTEGRLDTKPSIVGGAFDPWRKNSAECGKKCFATFQTVRSSAVVRVAPESGGFFVYLSVYEEIEDLPDPLCANVGTNMQYNDDLSRLQQAVGERQQSKGWIPVGRNREQESRILKEIGWRAGVSRTVLHEGVDASLVP